MIKSLLQKFALTMLLMSPFAAGAQVIYSEPFASGSLPAGWSNDSLGQPSTLLWQFDNPFARVVTGAGFDANFAIFDSDQGSTNDGIDELASLTSPSINISTAAGSLFLELDQQYRSLGGPSTGGSSQRIEYSTDAGASWTTLLYDSIDLGYPNPAVHSQYDLSSLVGVATDIQVRFTWTGSWDWWWAIDNVSFVSYAACTTPPNAGTAVADLPSACSTDSIHLSLVGSDVATGLSYQWQSSPDGSTWSDILGATTLYYTTAQNAATHYQCNVTCSGVTSASVEVVVGQNPASACFCVPGTYGFCSLNGGDYISNVSIIGTTLDNTSVCDSTAASMYTFFPVTPSTTANLTRNSSYTLSVNTSSDNIISVWIDYDQNGTFDASEWAQVCTTSVAGTPNTINIIIPGTALVGETVMRIRSRGVGNTNGATDACTDFYSGESEDYAIGIETNVGIVNLLNSQMSLVPNPTTGALEVNFGMILTKATLRVFDMMGNLVQNKEISNSFSQKLDLSSYPNGMYLVRVETQQGPVTKKVLLNR